MRRVCWTADFAEANIAAGLLHANGIEATISDAGMAQLNWMQTLAIGGYRPRQAGISEFATPSRAVISGSSRMRYSTL